MVRSNLQCSSTQTKDRQSYPNTFITLPTGNPYSNRSCYLPKLDNLESFHEQVCQEQVSRTFNLTPKIKTFPGRLPHFGTSSIQGIDRRLYCLPLPTEILLHTNSYLTYRKFQKTCNFLENDLIFWLHEMDVDYFWIQSAYIHSFIPYPHHTGRDMKIPVYINEDLESYGTPKLYSHYRVQNFYTHLRTVWSRFSSGRP